MSVELNASVVFITDACHSGKLGSDNRCTCPASKDLIKAPGKIRIGDYAPQGDVQVNPSAL